VKGDFEMFDTYFKQCTTRSEVRKRRNSLAKQLHPDLGGNEEEMKILNAECERRLQEITENEPQNGTITVESKEIVENILSKLDVDSREICPGNPMTITLECGVAPSKVLKIESAIREELGKHGTPFRLKYWGARKSRPYEIFTSGCITFIDVDAEETYLHYVKQTRNCEEALYKTHAAYVFDGTYGEKWYEAHWDNKRMHGYLMHRSKTLSLSDLLAGVSI
jgi:hypothetical protein